MTCPALTPFHGAQMRPLLIVPFFLILCSGVVYQACEVGKVADQLRREVARKIREKVWLPPYPSSTRDAFLTPSLTLMLYVDVCFRRSRSTTATWP